MDSDHFEKKLKKLFFEKRLLKDPDHFEKNYKS